MAKLDINSLSGIDGFIGAALVDSDSGMALAKLGGGSIDLDIAASGNTEVVKSKRRVASALKINEKIDDILISLERQYHIIRPLERNETLFLYLVLDRAKSNLALARHELKTFEQNLDFS